MPNHLLEFLLVWNFEFLFSGLFGFTALGGVSGSMLWELTFICGKIKFSY